jgi:hypothetical protein
MARLYRKLPFVGNGDSSLPIFELENRYKKFMSSVPSFDGKSDAKAYVNAIIAERDHTQSELQDQKNLYQGFRNHVFFKLTAVIVKPETPLAQRPQTADQALEQVFQYCSNMNSTNSRLGSDLMASQKKNQTMGETISDLQSDINNLKRNNALMARNYEERIEKMKQEYRRDMDELDHRHKQRLDAEMKLHKKNAEQWNNQYHSTVQNLDVKYKDLENIVIDASDDFTPIPDNSFDNQMKTLKLKIQNFAQKQAPKSKNFLEKDDDSEEWLALAGRKTDEKYFVFEKQMWAILENYIFKTPFQALGKYGEEIIHQLWLDIILKGDCISEPPRLFANRFRQPSEQLIFDLAKGDCAIRKVAALHNVDIMRERFYLK